VLKVPLNYNQSILVTPLLMGPVCLLSQGRFEEPGHPCWSYYVESWSCLSSSVSRVT